VSVTKTTQSQLNPKGMLNLKKEKCLEELNMKMETSILNLTNNSVNIFR